MNISSGMDRLGKVVFWALTLGGLFAAMLPAYGYSDAEMITSLEQAAKKINSQLPLITQGSMLVAVRVGPGKRITYSSVASTPRSEWTKSMLDRARQMNINGFCTKPNFSLWREENVSVVYESSDQNNVFLYSNTVSTKDCR